MSKRSASRGVIALGVAVILAGIATLALVSYMRGVRAEAARDVEAVEVFVAKDAIPAGMSANAATTQGLIERGSVPRMSVADGAVSSLGQIEGRVAAVTIMKGEQILSSRFVEEAQAGDKLPIAEDHQAMSFQVGIPPGVAGFIEVGDHISIVAQMALPGEEGNLVKYLLQDVEVLAVGRRVVTTDPETGQTTKSTQSAEENVLLTVALEPNEAEKLAYALFNGQLHLTLLPEDGQEPANTPGRNAQNAFDD